VEEISVLLEYFISCLLPSSVCRHIELQVSKCTGSGWDGFNPLHSSSDSAVV